MNNPWRPITEKIDQFCNVDILFGDGTTIIGTLPQSDGDFWWNGGGAGETFFDPQGCDITHWRVSSIQD